MSCRTKKSQRNKGKGFITFEEWLTKNADQIEKNIRAQELWDMFWRILFIGSIGCIVIFNLINVL